MEKDPCRYHILGSCRPKNTSRKVLVLAFPITSQKKFPLKKKIKGHCFPPAMEELEKPSPLWLMLWARWSLLLHRNVGPACSLWSQGSGVLSLLVRGAKEVGSVTESGLVLKYMSPDSQKTKCANIERPRKVGDIGFVVRQTWDWIWIPSPSTGWVSTVSKDKPTHLPETAGLL